MTGTLTSVTFEGWLSAGEGIWWPGNGVFALVLPKYDSFAAFLQITFARTVSNLLTNPRLFLRCPKVVKIEKCTNSFVWANVW